jgi:Family of unknown function (DUF6364)
MASRKKLTLSIDSDVIERARRYSKDHETSISQLVSTYLSQLDERADPRFSPTVRRLLGILPGDVALEDYRRHLEEKHSR